MNFCRKNGANFYSLQKQRLMNLTPVIAYEYSTTLEPKVGKDVIPLLVAKVVGTAIGAGTAGGGAGFP